MALSPEVEADRRTGIAATDAAPILGVSPFKSPAEVWLEKKKPHLVDFKESKVMYWGIRHEQTIAEEYTKVTGVNLVSTGLIRNKNLNWIMCSPDRLLDGRKKGVELKTADSRSAYSWGPAGTDMIPQHYLIQVQHSMMATNFDEWDVAALIGGNDFRIYHIFRDQELMRILFQQEKEFYTRFIAGNETPNSDWGKSIAEAVRKKHPQHNSTILSVDENGDDVLKKALHDLLMLRRELSKTKKSKSTQETLIKAYMKDSYKLTWTGEGIEATWKTSKESVKIDWRAVFEETLPHLNISAKEKKDLIDRHTKSKAAQRRFVFKSQDEEDEDEDGDDDF